jgi:hypothetical protein
MLPLDVFHLPRLNEAVREEIEHDVQDHAVLHQRLGRHRSAGQGVEQKARRAGDP